MTNPTMRDNLRLNLIGLYRDAVEDGTTTNFSISVRTDLLDKITRAALTIVQAFDDALPDGVHGTLAGGFVRDMLLGRRPKDIDIFVRPLERGDAIGWAKSAEEVVRDALGKLPGGEWIVHKHVPARAALPYAHHFESAQKIRRIVTILNARHIGGGPRLPDVQVIILDSPLSSVDLFESFDLGLVQAMLTPLRGTDRAIIKGTHQFLVDHFEERVTMCINVHAFRHTAQASLRRAIANAYDNEWPIVMPFSTAEEFLDENDPALLVAGI